MSTPASPALADIRREYTMRTLGEHEVDRDPLKQFGAWMDEAIRAQALEPTAMTLSTVDGRGQPTGRVCLLKGLEGGGFVFFTNYGSRKGGELAVNPRACMTFFWKELERQVRVEGTVSKVTVEESEAYFRQRPLGSRIGAWASPQSRVIENREWLESRIEAMSREHGENPPRPPHWGGYRLDPAYLEFWQGRMSRLHDRIAYTRDAGTWRIERLAP